MPLGPANSAAAPVPRLVRAPNPQSSKTVSRCRTCAAIAFSRRVWHGREHQVVPAGPGVDPLREAVERGSGAPPAGRPQRGPVGSAADRRLRRHGRDDRRTRARTARRAGRPSRRVPDPSASRQTARSSPVSAGGTSTAATSSPPPATADRETHRDRGLHPAREADRRPGLLGRRFVDLDDPAAPAQHRLPLAEPGEQVTLGGSGGQVGRTEGDGLQAQGGRAGGRDRAQVRAVAARAPGRSGCPAAPTARPGGRPRPAAVRTAPRPVPAVRPGRRCAGPGRRRRSGRAAPARRPAARWRSPGAGGPARRGASGAAAPPGDSALQCASGQGGHRQAERRVRAARVAVRASRTPAPPTPSSSTPAQSSSTSRSKPDSPNPSATPSSAGGAGIRARRSSGDVPGALAAGQPSHQGGQRGGEELVVGVDPPGVVARGRCLGDGHGTTTRGVSKRPSAPAPEHALRAVDLHPHEVRPGERRPAPGRSPSWRSAAPGRAARAVRAWPRRTCTPVRAGPPAGGAR